MQASDLRSDQRDPDPAALPPGSPEHIAEVERRLRGVYGCPRHHNPEAPLDDLVFLVLSRMTQEVKYVRTYRALRKALPDWEGVREAPPDELEALLADAGLARTKARQLKAILEEVTRREGALDLSRLRQLEDAEVEGYLTSLPGVATKTARCVMLYTLERDVFPVDAHVWRICQRLGLATPGSWTDAATRRLQARVPQGLGGSLHRTMVAHGREVCRARRARCSACVLCELCPSAPERRALQ